jgi:hypothetical protein
MFGFEARRIRTTVIKQSSRTACDKSPMKVEVDAWYVDLPNQSSCVHPSAAPPTPPPSPDPDACTDRLETQVVGDARLGFPVKMVTTSTTGEGDNLAVSTSSEEVTELEVTRLEAGLFDVPADFVEANSSAEVVPLVASGVSLSDAIFGSTADGRGAAAPKAAGRIRIGILEPVNRTERNLPPASLRQDLASRFSKAPYEAIPIAGSSPEAIDAEAARLECDYLMLTEIVEARTSKPGRLSGLSRVTGGGPPSDSHDVRLEFRLFAVGAPQSALLSGSARASNGGFGVGSALRLAAFAGQLYMSMMMGGMNSMNPMMAMSGMGGLGPTGGGLFDPRAAAMSSMFAGLDAGVMSGMAGLADPSEAGMRDTASEALGNGAKAVMEQLTRRSQKR